jgi:hypothetical protein
MEAAALKELANYGVLGVFAVLVVIAIWRLAKWWAPKLDELWKALVGLVHETRTTISQVGENSKQLINISQTQAEASERIESQIIATGKTVDGHTFVLNSLGQRIDEHGETLEAIKARLPQAPK